MKDRIDTELGNYRLLQLLGHGGFADVYLAEHRYLKRKAAVKIQTGMIAESDLNSFLHEAQTIASLKHQHILPVFDFGMEGATPFLVMEYAANGTLRARHPCGTQVPLPIVVEYVRCLADALQYAHNMYVIHRDIKPENILLDDRDKVAVSDFGIAAVEHSASSVQAIDNRGTPYYMSPEQFQGKPTAASDQYALAVVVYEWLCGQYPYLGDSFYAIGMQHFSSPVPSLRTHNVTLSPDLERVVQTALAKDPKNRFANIQAFALAFEQAAVSPVPSFSLPLPHTFPITSKSQQREPASVSPVPSFSLPPTHTFPTVPESQQRENITEVSPSSLSSPTSIHPPIAPGTPLLTYTAHTSFVDSLSWSPDNSQIASASQDGTVQLWQTQTGEQQLTYRGHTDWVFSVAWSPDGTKIASASRDKTVQIWDAHTGNQLVLYTGHTDDVYVIAWSPDSTRLASAGFDDKVQIWSAENGKHLLTYTGHNLNGETVTWINTVAWSPDGTHIASAGIDKTVQVWDANHGHQLLTYRGHTKLINAIAWSPNGTRIASASHDETVQVWDVATGKQQIAYRGHFKPINSVVWSPDGKYIASAGYDKIVLVWDAHTGNHQFLCDGHSKWVNSLAWSTDGLRLASASGDNTVCIWQA
jgi:WD40 repeat protein